MKITVINGTQQKGCTYQMKEMFLDAIGGDHEIIEYTMPDDSPEFCTGCKACFFNGIDACPHKKYTVPIWSSILAADLLVFTSPTYVFHTTGQMKALLDHYGSKWMAHSPEPALFTKQAVIITNAIGQGMGKTAKDIKDSLDFWGVARTYTIKQALFSADWDEVTAKVKARILKNCNRVASKISRIGVVMPRLKIKGLFLVMKMAQKMINKAEIKKGHSSTADYKYWKEQGFLDGRKPWKK